MLIQRNAPELSDSYLLANYHDVRVTAIFEGFKVVGPLIPKASHD